jgi:hypothetical protein
MVGFRTLEFYIGRYGDSEGRIRFEKCVSLRERRIFSKKAGFNTTKEQYTMKDVENGDAVCCKACGAISTRLQWTHFKHKCVVKSINEYKERYPDAPLVAPNLCKLVGVTRERMVALYGEEEGGKRWQTYCDKQAESNTLDYKMKKHGWSEEQFNSYNASRSVTVENMIKRYGEEEGLCKWEEYCEKQRYTCSLEYFEKTYGMVDGKKRYDTWRDNALYKTGCISKPEIEVYNFLCEMGFNLTKQLKIKNSNKTFAYDYVDEDRKKIIEFNGDYWHCNPKFYNESFFHKIKKKTAKEIWDYDLYKTTVATSNGYSIFIIWEYDWKNNQSELLDRLKRWYGE